MKIRNGFVSNSSSSSFIIQKEKLNGCQIDKIKNHIEYSKNLSGFELCDYNESWSIYETENEIQLYASMDNFDMYKFLLLIGIDDEDIVPDDF